MILTIVLSDTIQLTRRADREWLYRLDEFYTVGYVIHSVIRHYHLEHSVSHSLEEYGLALYDSEPAQDGSPFSSRHGTLMDNTPWLDPLQTLGSYFTTDVCELDSLLNSSDRQTYF
jgi:hypothetical protein